MAFRGNAARGILSVLLFGFLLVVTVGLWLVLTLAVSVVAGDTAAIVFAAVSALSVTVGYGLVRASGARE